MAGRTRPADRPVRRARHGRPGRTHGGVHVLTLTRSVGETIRIGDDIEIHVVEVRGGTVRLGFKAPREVTIHREEVYRQIAEANRSEEHTSELQSRQYLVCRLLLEKKKRRYTLHGRRS